MQNKNKSSIDIIAHLSNNSQQKRWTVCRVSNTKYLENLEQYIWFLKKRFSNFSPTFLKFNIQLLFLF